MARPHPLPSQPSAFHPTLGNDCGLAITSVFGVAVMIRLRMNPISNALAALAALFYIPGYITGTAWAQWVGGFIFAPAVALMIYLTYGKLGCLGIVAALVLVFLFALVMSM